MKKVLAIISAGILAALAFSSCVKEEQPTFDYTKATAPVLGNYTIGEEEIMAKYTPGAFNMGFNEEMPVNHALAVVSLNGEAVSKTLTTTNKEGVLSLKLVNLAKALISLGAAEGSTADVELAVRATMQEVARDNGINGHIDSEGHIRIASFQVVVPEIVGSPYADYLEDSDWSVIGALSAYGISWDGDLNMWTDGNGNHVAAHVTLKADDEFKFRKDQAWTVNMGGEFGGLGNEFGVTQDGPNIKVGADGVYDLYVNPDAGTAWITEAYDPYPDYTEASNWSVIGSLSKHGISWDGDLAMISDGNWHVALSVNLGADDEFKFRQDAAWTVNLGGEFGGLDNEFGVTQDGPNIKVGAEGSYDLFVNPGGSVAKVTEASGAKVSSKIGETTPVEPVEITGWNIIGLNGDWENDILATESDGVWTAYVTAVEDTQFKWRKDGKWDENYGGVMNAIGEPFTAEPGGSDIPIPAGNWKIELNLNDLTITVSTVSYELPDIDLSQYELLADDMSGAETWGIIGPAVTNWDTDYDLQKVQDDPEVWAGINVPFVGGSFKFRGNDTWADYDLGGGEYALNTPILLSKGGGDMTADRGVFNVFLYPTYGIAYITEGSGDVPPPPAKPDVWSLIGTLNGTSWDTDFDLTNTSGDIWKIRNVAIAEADEFKLRADHDWGVNVGGPEENDVSTIEEGNPYGVYKPVLGTAFEAGGKNIRIGAAGNYDITFDYAANTILIEEYKEYPEHMYMIGEAIGGWEWSGDYVVDMIPVINNEWGGDATGQFYAIRWLPAGQGFKFCAQKAWSGDFWGLETNDGFTESGGNCTVAEDGIYMIHIDLKNSKVHVEPARVYGIGDCAGGKWDEGMEEVLYKADGKSLKLTLANSGSVRAYVASEIATSSWWTREFAVIDGKIQYRTGDELSWPMGSKDQVVTFNFNDGTGSIEGEAAPPEPYALIGWHAADSWSTNVELIDVEGQPNWRVAKYIGSNSGNIDFKFRRGSAWVPQIGATEKAPKNLNELFKVTEKTDGAEPDPANIHLDGNSVYDIYLNEKELCCFILEAGSDFAVPTTWESGETPEMDWYIIGEAVGGWDTENDVPLLDEGEGFYVARGVNILGEKNFKFRANHAWTYQLTCPGLRTPGITFDLEDGNGSGNDMQVAADGVYDVFLSKDLKQAVIMSTGGGEVNITIDGDMSDWASVPGEETPDNICKVMKVHNDADNFYVYLASEPGPRGNALWGDASGYYYIDFDWDNNDATGIAENSNPGFDCWFYMYVFGGTADAPYIKEHPNGDGKEMKIDNITAKGVITSELIQIELSIPRADMVAVEAGTVTRILSWRSKDGTKIQMNYTVK